MRHQEIVHTRHNIGPALVLGLSLVFLLSTVLGAAAPIYPLKVSANNRYLVDQNDTPYLMQGDAAWSLIVAAKDSEVEEYLRNRQQKGFNAVMVELIEHRFSDHPPLNLDGEAPFAIPGDFTTPSERYFAHADWVIKKAGGYGIQVLLFPIYLGYKGTDEGWIEELKKVSPNILSMGSSEGMTSESRRNSGTRTPAIVNWLPSSVMLLPTIRGSAPKRRSRAGRSAMPPEPCLACLRRPSADGPIEPSRPACPAAEKTCATHQPAQAFRIL